MVVHTKSRGWTVMLLLCLLIAIAGGILVDHWQGGPLGRQFHSGGSVEGVNAQVGEHVLLGEGADLLNSTPFPFHIESVQPLNGSPDAKLTGGIVTVRVGQPIPGVVRENQSLYPFDSRAVAIPTGAGTSKQYALALLVTAERPGSFVVHGLLVKYRWGPFTYTTKYPEKFEVSISQP